MGLIPREVREIWPANLTDVDHILQTHGDDGTGYCRAACNLRGWQYPAGKCPAAVDAREARDQLLAERRLDTPSRKP